MLPLTRGPTILHRRLSHGCAGRIFGPPMVFLKNGGVGPILFQVSSRPQGLDRRETIETSFRVKRNHVDTMLNDDLSASRGAAKLARFDGMMAG